MLAMDYINGKFVAKDEAKVHISDLGLTRGYGLFDYLRTYSGRLFHLDDHLDRLHFSMHHLDLRITDDIKPIIQHLLEKRPYDEIGMKIIVTGGNSRNGLMPEGSPNLIISVDEAKVFDFSCYSKGVGVITSTIGRTFPQVKSLNYMGSILTLSGSRASEVLYLNSIGEVLEGATSNFFAIKGDTLITSSSEEVLFGITREIVLHLAKDDFKIEKRNLATHELSDMDEAFITSSTREIMPVVQIDQMQIGEGEVGPKTKRLKDAFTAYTERDSWPYLGISRHCAPLQSHS